MGRNGKFCVSLQLEIKNNMKRTSTFLIGIFVFLSVYAESWIRINQVGYLPNSKKVAVLISDDELNLKKFHLINCSTGKAMRYKSLKRVPSYGKMVSCYRLDFSAQVKSGDYVIKAGEALSDTIHISSHVWDGSADFLLHYMRQQRCGYNPFFRDSCHTHDGYIVYHPTKTGQKIDVRGGWHDAADMLQYTATSANATYQMLFAYQQNPDSFSDHYDANGLEGSNSIPDILDEAKWGMDWLCRMNPNPGEYYNQIADDRDHAGMRFPQKDSVDYGYGKGKGRPVYYCSGQPQQRGKFMNATTGIANTAGKFSSCFSLGSKVFAPFFPEFASSLETRSKDAYQSGRAKPGTCQTASVLSPYIYEECNWTDDMELASLGLYLRTGNAEYLEQGVEYGRQEPVTPWMGADSARHYQWYPFMNMGHVRLASLNPKSRLSQEFLRNLKSGIERTYEKAQSSAYLNGLPYIWCSNNLCVAMLTQCRLYRELSGDEQFEEMETSLLDWLFGCNPWGTCMIVEFPGCRVYPTQPHSGCVRLGLGNATGGLVDGPVYSNIFNSLLGVDLRGLPNQHGQAYEYFQPEQMVYHDAIGDYSTNEPTMDGTACLTYYLSGLQKDGKEGLNSKHP